MLVRASNKTFDSQIEQKIERNLRYPIDSKGTRSLMCYSIVIQGLISDSGYTYQ